jgi:hypothetical protein
MGTLVDMNSEPAVEDLSRQILSEAKLWEAIQEARVELLRRRQEQVRMRHINDAYMLYTLFCPSVLSRISQLLWNPKNY